MVEVENRLYAGVAALRQQPRLVVDLADDYGELGRLGRALDVSGREAVGRETAAMQALSGEVNTFIYWQLVALIPVALFLVSGATILILKPIRQVEAALKRLGEGDFHHPVSVSGPKDLEDLGRQIDWVRLRLIELEDQKTRFLHQVSHELKTPLSAIREGAELMADGSVGPLSQPQVEVARILRENTLRLQRLIEDLLNYHTVQFQRSGVHLRRVELAPVIRRVAEAHQLPMQAKDIKLKISCPAIALEADENKLEIILDNLVSNAVKFSPPFRGDSGDRARARPGGGRGRDGPGAGHRACRPGADLRSLLPGQGAPPRNDQGHRARSGDRARVRSRARRQGPDRGWGRLRRALPAAAAPCAHCPGTLMPSRRLSALPWSGALPFVPPAGDPYRAGTRTRPSPADPQASASGSGLQRFASPSCWQAACKLRPASRRR